MAPDLHVLVYGSLDDGACPTYRFGMHREALLAHGVELRAFTDYALGVPEEAAGSVEGAFDSREVVLDRSGIDWADVIVFRRFYVTRWNCTDCALVTVDRSEADRHRDRVGHTVQPPDRLVRPLFTALEQVPELLRGRAIVYETDDDLLNVKAWNGVSRRVAAERDVIERMVRRADLVTVATPVLAARHRHLNEVVRVVRNAIDPAWYHTDVAAPPPVGDPRLLYYGKPTRMRDYDVCRPAVDAVAAHFSAARRVWLGAVDAPGGGSPEPVRAAVDEVGPYVAGAEAFSRSLAAARPDIGLAPLVGDEFDQAKSELHWLELSMAGAAVVATSISGGGPFDVVRDGVDGLLAATPADWMAALTRLAASRGLREDLAGRARERILAESTVALRAAEWADAYRWAAEHAGRAVAGRIHGLGELTPARLVREARASLDHRSRTRGLAATAPDRLRAARSGRSACWLPNEASAPLVSVLVPVLDEPLALVARAIRSALSPASDAPAVEVLVAVNPSDAGPIGELPEVRDPRVHIVSPLDVPALASEPGADAATRTAATVALLRVALAAARGGWIRPLSPEGKLDNGSTCTLLEVAVENELELVYGQAVVEAPDGTGVVLGAWPPNADGVLTLGAELFSARLSEVIPFDADAWRDGDSCGWAFWRAAIEAGARIAGIEVPVVRLTAGPVAA